MSLRLPHALLLFTVPMGLAFRCDPPPPSDAGPGDAPSPVDEGGWEGDAGASADGGGEPDAESCVIYEIQRRQCYRNAGSNATLVDVWSCTAGRSCDRPEGYSVSRDTIMCVDSWRYQRAVFPATCAEVEDYEAGRLECLTTSHCAGGLEEPNDWACDASRTCVCPPGGHCPVLEPLAPSDGMPDAGAMPDAGPGPGSADAGPAPTSDGGPTPEPTPAGAGTPAPPGPPPSPAPA